MTQIQTKEQHTYDIIERLSVDNEFYVSMYKYGETPTYDLSKNFVKVTVDELKQAPYDAYDACIEEMSGNNLNYFEIQPRDISQQYNDHCDSMIEHLKKHQPHMMLHFDAESDTCDVYVVSKK